MEMRNSFWKLEERPLKERFSFSLLLIVKCKKEVNCRKKESELEDLQNSQPIYTVKSEGACSEENTMSMAEQPFDKEIMGATHGFNQPPQQKPGIEVELYQQKHNWN